MFPDLMAATLMVNAETSALEIGAKLAKFTRRVSSAPSRRPSILARALGGRWFQPPSANARILAQAPCVQEDRKPLFVSIAESGHE